jgi:hypothetical protein
VKKHSPRSFSRRRRFKDPLSVCDSFVPAWLWSHSWATSSARFLLRTDFNLAAVCVTYRLSVTYNRRRRSRSRRHRIAYTTSLETGGTRTFTFNEPDRTDCAEWSSIEIALRNEPLSLSFSPREGNDPASDESRRVKTSRRKSDCVTTVQLRDASARFVIYLCYRKLKKIKI